MTLHPHITLAELNAYCALAWEHRIRKVHVDIMTYQRITALVKNKHYSGIEFKPAQ